MKLTLRKLGFLLLPLSGVTLPLAIAASCGDSSEPPAKTISQEALDTIKKDLESIRIDVNNSVHDKIKYLGLGDSTTIKPSVSVVTKYEYLSTDISTVSAVKLTGTWDKDLPTRVEEDKTKRHFWVKANVISGITLTDEQMFYDLAGDGFENAFSVIRTQLQSLRVSPQTSTALTGFDFNKAIRVTSGDTLDVSKIQILEDKTVTIPEGTRLTYQFGNSAWKSKEEIIALMKAKTGFSGIDLVDLRARLETLPENLQSIYASGSVQGVPGLKDFYGQFPWLTPLSEAYSDIYRIKVNANSSTSNLVWNYTPRSNAVISGYQYLSKPQYKTLEDVKNAGSGDYINGLPNKTEENSENRNLWVRLSVKPEYASVIPQDRIFVDITANSDIRTIRIDFYATQVYQDFLKGVEVSGTQGNIVVTEPFTLIPGVQVLYQYNETDDKKKVWISKDAFTKILNDRGIELVKDNLVKSEVKIEVTDEKIFNKVSELKPLKYGGIKWGSVVVLSPDKDRLQNIKLGRYGNVQSGEYTLTFTKQNVVKVNANDGFVTLDQEPGEAGWKDALEPYVKQTVPFFDGEFNYSPMPLAIYNAYEQGKLSVEPSIISDLLYINENGKKTQVNGKNGDIYGFTKGNVWREKTLYNFSVSGLKVVYKALDKYALSAEAEKIEITPQIDQAGVVLDAQTGLEPLKDRIAIIFTNLSQAEKKAIFKKMTWSPNAPYSLLTYPNTFGVEDLPTSWRSFVGGIKYSTEGVDEASERPTKLEEPQSGGLNPKFEISFAPKNSSNQFIVQSIDMYTTHSQAGPITKIDIFDGWFVANILDV